MGTQIDGDSQSGMDRCAVLVGFSFRELLRTTFIGGGTRCRIITAQLVLRTSHGKVTLPTAKIRVLQFRHDLFSLHVVATMLGGGTFRGKLLTKRLQVKYPDSAGTDERNCRKLSYIYAHSLDAPQKSPLLRV